MTKNFEIQNLSVVLYGGTEMAVGLVEPGQNADESVCAGDTFSLLLLAPNDPRTVPVDQEPDLVLAPRNCSEVLELARVAGQLQAYCLDVAGSMLGAQTTGSGRQARAVTGRNRDGGA